MPLTLPMRRGPRPQTTPHNPHEQLDQNATADWQEQLWDRMQALPGVHRRASAIAPLGSRALWLDDPGARPEMFMVGREFAHLHPRYDGSLHLVLDAETRAEALRTGWAEPHPLAGRFAPAATVMVYGPRDAIELDVVAALVAQSLRYVRGELGDVEETDIDGPSER